MKFDQEHLVALGFAGFVPVRGLGAKPRTVPADPGIYAVTMSRRPADFRAASPGGHFKGKDPTVSLDQLQAKWIEGSETLYIGRASSLRERLGLLARFGRGDAVAHWGGRYLWQLVALDELRVSWRVELDPLGAERDLLECFEDEFGALPFANLVRGSRAALAA